MHPINVLVLEKFDVKICKVRDKSDMSVLQFYIAPEATEKETEMS